MKRYFQCLVALLFTLGQVIIAHAAPPRLIVRGDDMGAAHSINEAIMQCHRDGIQTAIEVIVPSPWFPEAVAMLSADAKVDVGVHLALTSEWDNVKWRPVSDCPSIRDADGYFFPMIHPNKNYPQRALAEQKWDIADIEKEFRAQIQLAIKKIPRVSHLSGHMGCDRISPEVRAMVKKLAVEYQLDIWPDELGVKGIRYIGARNTAEEKVESLMKALSTLEDNNNYLFVDHPGLDSPELRAIHHIGYENVAIDRQGVTTAWCDKRVRQLIESRHIQLISYKDLKQTPVSGEKKR